VTILEKSVCFNLCQIFAGHSSKVTVKLTQIGDYLSWSVLDLKMRWERWLEELAYGLQSYSVYIFTVPIKTSYQVKHTWVSDASFSPGSAPSQPQWNARAVGHWPRHSAQEIAWHGGRSTGGKVTSPVPSPTSWSQWIQHCKLRELQNLVLYHKDVGFREPYNLFWFNGSWAIVSKCH